MDSSAQTHRHFHDLVRRPFAAACRQGSCCILVKLIVSKCIKLDGAGSMLILARVCWLRRRCCDIV